MTADSTLFKSSTFRLAAAYLVIFALSAAATLGYVYWNTAGLMERQTESTIRAEVDAISDQFSERGLAGVIEIIERRVSERTPTLYMLAAPDGHLVAGNFSATPKPNPDVGGWVDFQIEVGGGSSRETHSAHAFGIELPGDFDLIVGRDVEELRAFQTLIQNTLMLAIVPILLLGLAGGILTSRNFLRRIDAITQTSSSIMAGDLSQRMPVIGSNDELDRLSASLNQMLEQIERLMQGMREVTSNVAHDLRTPLTRLRAQAESALRNNDVGEQRRSLQQTLVESDRMLQIFNALLSIARADAGFDGRSNEAVDLAAIIEDVSELYVPLIEEEGGTFKSSLEEGVIVSADRQLVSQVFSNLFDNAMKYGANLETGRVNISIALETSRNEAVVTVSDTGAGVPENEREHVLQRFFRLDESRSKPGNGLGLSLVASVVRLHGGNLMLQDAAPGLKVVITLPLVTRSV